MNRFKFYTKYYIDKVKMSVADINPVRVYITPEAAAKQNALINLCPAEIGWFGRVETLRDAKGHTFFRVNDILVPDQTVTVASVDQEGAELVPFMMEHADIMDKLLYYGHSHVDFDVFTSAVDYSQILGWREFGVPFMISWIGNKRGEELCRIDTFEPHELTMRAQLVVEPTGVEVAWAREQITEHVEIWDQAIVNKKHKRLLLKEKGEHKILTIREAAEKGRLEDQKQHEEYDELMGGGGWYGGF